MGPQGVERRLTTILCADVVGYTRLMATDEAGTLARLKAHRKELLEPKTVQYHGRVVKLMGDGVLMEFGSVIDAVNFAAEVQREMMQRNAEVPEDARIVYRIGINIGDIIVDGDDIYGDGVNVASRLEALADPGGICVTSDVINQVRNKVTLAFEDAGAHRAMNFPDSIQVYRVRLAPVTTGRVIGRRLTRRTGWRWTGAAAAAVAGAAVWLYHSRVEPPQDEVATADTVSWNLPAEPSIAVLPFVNLGSDPDQEYFTDGITNDITTDLAKFSTLFVIASNSSFRYKGRAVKVQDVARDLGVRYVLEGSVQWIGNQLRVNAQLIDATTGRHVWAQKYDRKATDLFVVQKEVTAKIVGVIGASSVSEGALQQAELERIARTPTENLEAYDYFLRGRLHRDRETKEDTEIAHRMFERAVELDPEYARAMAEDSLAHLDEIWGDWTESRERTLEMAKQLALRAIELDNVQPHGYHALGYVYQFQGRIGQAIGMWEKAYALNPNDYETNYALGYGLAYTGQPERGISILERARLINPFHAEDFLRSLGQVYFFGRRYQDAVATHDKITRRHRTSFWLYLAASYAQLDRIPEARAAIAEARKMKPELSLEREIARRLENGLSADNAEHLRIALRKAELTD